MSEHLCKKIYKNSIRKCLPPPNSARLGLSSTLGSQELRASFPPALNWRAHFLGGAGHQHFSFCLNFLLLRPSCRQGHWRDWSSLKLPVEGRYFWEYWVLHHSQPGLWGSGPTLGEALQEHLRLLLPNPVNPTTPSTQCSTPKVEGPIHEKGYIVPTPSSRALA